MQRDNLAEQRRELFGERNPDSEEKRLAAALSQAATRREEALRDQNRLQNEIDGLEQRIQKLTESITARTTQLLTLESALQLRMNEAGFADEAAFLQARLPQARFDELSRLAEALRIMKWRYKPVAGIERLPCSRNWIKNCPKRLSSRSGRRTPP